jgi:hypothetical protein
VASIAPTVMTWMSALRRASMGSGLGAARLAE